MAPNQAPAPVADWRKDAKRLLKEMTDSIIYKPKEGKTILRILPGHPSKDVHPYAKIVMHYKVGPSQRSQRCGKDWKGGGKCWLCDVMIPKLLASPHEKNKTFAENMQPSVESYVQVAIWDPEEKAWEGPKLWKVSDKTFKTILAEVDENYVENITEGYNFTLTATGASGTMQRRYPAFTRATKPSPVSPKILAKLKPLSEVLLKYDEKEMARVYMGKDREAPPTPEELASESEAHPQAAPARRAAAPAPAKRRAAAPVEEEPAEEEVIEEELVEEELVEGVEEIPAEEGDEELPPDEEVSPESDLEALPELEGEEDELLADAAGDENDPDLPDMEELDNLEPEPEPEPEPRPAKRPAAVPAKRSAPAPAKAAAPAKKAATPPRKPVPAARPATKKR